MNTPPIIAFTIALCLLTFSCRKESPSPPEDITGAVQVIQNYADSFEGLTVSEAKSRISNSNLREEDWDEEGIIDGKIISAQYKGYELMLVCHDGSVVTSSVQFLSDEE